MTVWHYDCILQEKKIKSSIISLLLAVFCAAELWINNNNQQGTEATVYKNSWPMLITPKVWSSYLRISLEAEMHWTINYCQGKTFLNKKTSTSLGLPSLQQMVLIWIINSEFTEADCWWVNVQILKKISFLPSSLRPPPVTVFSEIHLKSHSKPRSLTFGLLSLCLMILLRLLVMWVSRLLARFHGLHIQWLSSPLWEIESQSFIHLSEHSLELIYILLCLNHFIKLGTTVQELRTSDW